MATSIHTLLFITNTRIARIDFTGRRSLRVASFRIEARSTNSLASAIAESLALISNRPGPVSILTSEAWSEVLYLPKDVVSIASISERDRALALDAEAESGISAFESQVASVQLSSKERDSVPFCVTQIANSHLRELAKLIRSHHSRLFCIAHPVAIDLAGQQSAGADEIIDRLMLWNEDSKRLTTTGDAESEVTRIAKVWTELLSPRFGSSTGQYLGPLWIKPNEPPLGKHQLAVLSVSIAILAAFGCISLNYRSRSSLNSIKQSIANIEKQQNDRTESLDAIKRTELRLTQLRKEASEAEAVRVASERQMQLATNYQARQCLRWSALMDGLAESAEDCWVKEINFDSGRTIIRGFAPSNAAAHSFASRLERRLHENGWVATPATTSASANGLVEFSVTLAVEKGDSQPSETGKQVVTIRYQIKTAISQPSKHEDCTVTKRASNHRILLLTIGPSMVITIFYFIFFHMSLQQSIKLETGKLRKLEAIEGRTKSGEEAERLVALREEVRKANDLIENANRSSSHFVAKRSTLCKELFESSSPADSIASAIGVFERNELKCLSSIPMLPQDSSPSKLPETLKPIAKILGTQKSLQSTRIEMQFSLHGSYLAMQNALRELREELAEVIIVSLEMLPCDGSDQTRSWILTVSI